MKFYVYEWFIIDTNEVFYVGKGCKNRYKVRKHNKLFNYILSQNKCDSRIIKNFDNEEDAFAYEFDRINQMWNKGQCKANINKGGAGGTISWWTPELRKQYSEKNVMKSEKQRERMSINNPMKKQEVQDKVKQYTQKSVSINNICYESVSEAANKYDTDSGTIRHWCLKGYNHLMEPCRYTNEEQKEYDKSKRYNKGGCRPIQYKDEIYEAAIDVANKLGINATIVGRWAKKGFDQDGNICQYLDDTETHIFKKYENGECCRKPIKVNGILYISKADAERKLNLKKGALAPYIAGTRRNKKFICEYVNQQPSHTNSDISSMKGSTTNE